MQKWAITSNPFLSLKVFFIFSVLTLLVLIEACSKAPDEEEMWIRIEGTVTEKTTGSPLADVTVDLYSEGFGTKKLSITDEEGYYSISFYGRYYGGFKIRAVKMGYYLWSEYIKRTSEIQIINIQLYPI